MREHGPPELTRAHGAGSVVELRPRRHPAAPAPPARVLVAEDSRLLAETLMFALDSDPALEPIGYALNGWEALELTATLEPSVILVGAGLTGLDSLAFTRLVHMLWPRIRIIVLGEAHASSEVATSHPVGAADCLPRDCSADELLHAIGDACAGQQGFERRLGGDNDLLALLGLPAGERR
jgi:DNA-binding NarL/FixJ family response regulator